MLEIVMSCEGVWKVEMVGAYGWEGIATAFMKNGEYMAASANHYSIGSYKQSDDNVVMSALVTQHGDLRTVFGVSSTSKLHVTLNGKIKMGIITGTSKAKGIKKHEIEFRLTRLERFE